MTVNRETSKGYLHFIENENSEQVMQFLHKSVKYSNIDIEDVVNKLRKGIEISIGISKMPENFNDETIKSLLNDMVCYKIIELKNEYENEQVTLKSAGSSFDLFEEIAMNSEFWKISRFSYLHFENNQIVLRNPQALCYLVVHDPVILSLFYAFQKALSKKQALLIDSKLQETVFDLFVKSKIIVPCNRKKRSFEEDNDTIKQWDFHDLVFHSLSRTGRTEKDIGGSFRYKGIIPPQPPIKKNIWKDNMIFLPKPNLNWLYYNDKSFTNVLESRKSTRQYSLLALSIDQLGEFLYRSARIRYEYSSDYGEFISKPYPGGGANYETEFYITINACAGVSRGMYYYDAKEHALCLVSEPNSEMENLLHDAFMATAMQGVPQILITLANRFNRFNWKYSSMSYAAQLKNIGVIYQTLYLVATSMNIGACGLGVGNTERFSKLTGLDYLEEGSVGEFMIGRIM